MITLNLYLAFFLAAATGGLAGALTCYRVLKGRSPTRVILHTDADTMRRMKQQVEHAEYHPPTIHKDTTHRA